MHGSYDELPQADRNLFDLTMSLELVQSEVFRQMVDYSQAPSTELAENIRESAMLVQQTYGDIVSYTLNDMDASFEEQRNFLLCLQQSEAILRAEKINKLANRRLIKNPVRFSNINGLDDETGMQPLTLQANVIANEINQFTTGLNRDLAYYQDYLTASATSKPRLIWRQLKHSALTPQSLKLLVSAGIVLGAVALSRYEPPAAD